ncbi:transporter substrate-binding domain-containing protein [Bosea sp. (in: a-proteobacteria)]|uniref:transporter substrate-binding domain-containing protein n=1 Tax=Bosea sp. (in: a-proteobacteria) TaxID=1871050 RepID=UPI0025B9F621|nr:transporter substrate-binding domain-containing protein [Bosea sp. (in: a-proteobacteria)]MBR3193384.1 transporter substrate-binding domain-containing protein [Bosea sp. (in: a-proteobacteria)]
MFKPTRRSLLVSGAVGLAMPAVLTRAAFAATPDEIKKRGKVIVGIQGDNPPFGFVNSSGKQEGLDAAMGELFAKELGVQVEFAPLAVANRIPALTAGRVDVLFATMAMLPERAKAVQYSKPYAANYITLVAAKSTVVKTNADMGKLVIGVPRSSTQDTQITKNAPEGTTIRRYDDDAATMQALLSGQVQAVGGNMFYVQRLNAQKPDTFEDKLEFQRLYNGACTRLGEKEINAAINSFIDKIKATGELAKAYATWMKVPLPEFPASVEGVPFVVS